MTVAPAQRLSDLEAAGFRADQRLDRIDVALDLLAGLPAAVSDLALDGRSFREEISARFDHLSTRLDTHDQRFDRLEGLLIKVAAALNVDPEFTKAGVLPPSE